MRIVRLLGWMSDIVVGLNNDEGYCMRLANGQGWRIVATERVKSWVEKLAFIMELETYEPNGYPRLIFNCRESGESWWGDLTWHTNRKITECLPKSGWRTRDFIWLQVWSHLNVPDVICTMGPQKGNEQDVLRMRMALQPVYQRAQESEGLPLHAALVERRGKGLLLAAPKDTGKSTCCSRIPRPWNALCDEETLIVRDVQKQYQVHPFPTWSDYIMKRGEMRWNIQQHVPLSAIFFLEQAEIDEVTPVGQGEAAVLINHSATQVCYLYWYALDHKDLRTCKQKLFENACELARSVPAYKLRVSLKGRFWEEMEKVLS